MVGYEKLNLLEDWRGMQMQLKEFLCHELVNIEDKHDIFVLSFG